MHYQIVTLPVYSKLAVAEELPKEIVNKCPREIRLYQHQLACFEGVKSDGFDVIFDTAMTGDGKSLAAYLDALVNNQPILGMYPTNELARDQEMQLNETMIPQWGAGGLGVATMSAARMDQIIESGDYDRKADVIRHLVDNNRILLTNPDIFYYVANFFYTRRTDAPDLLFGRKIMDSFETFLFDEFHVFQTPQIVSVLNAMLLMRVLQQQSHPKKFIFLSATPNELMADKLHKAGFRVKLIDPEANGWYAQGEMPGDAGAWRLILRGADIHFWNLRTVFSAEEWVEEHAEDVILQFFAAHPGGAKGAFIANSIASAYRIYYRLEPLLRARGLNIALNTGFTGETARKTSLDADFLVATATVDVGVDFRINFLVFESRDGGTFLQRLGRLGRHGGDRLGRTFKAFEAHALLPGYLNERLFVGRGKEPALLTPSTTIGRLELNKAIQVAFPDYRSFNLYAQHWGWVQSAHIYQKLCQKTVYQTYEQARLQLRDDIYRTFGFGIKKAIANYKTWSKEDHCVMDEAQSFRGGTPFECAVIDRQEIGADRVKRYNLLTLAANAELEWLGYEAFVAAAKRDGVNVASEKWKELAGWFIFSGFVGERRNVRIMLRHRVGDWEADRFGVAAGLNGLQLDGLDVSWLSDVNRHLRSRKFAANVCLVDPLELRIRLHLPPMFELLPFDAIDGAHGSIALGKQALLLETVLRESHFSSGGNAIIL